MWLTIVGQFFTSFFGFLGIYLLFDRFTNIAGWSFGEVAICYSSVNMAFSIAECYARGFDVFSNFIVKGDFDRILLRPRGSILQVLGSNFELTRIGRLIQSIIVMYLSITWLDTDWTFLKAVVLIEMVLSGVVIFTGIFIIGASICFWTVQGLEALNILTDGGREIAAYPLEIFPKTIVRFFTFVIPFGCFNYLPLAYLTGRGEASGYLYILAPFGAVLFILPCLWFWKVGVRHYLSTGN
jgi:ABC-2 type transport system permease protein